MQILAFYMKEGNQMNDKYYEQAVACVKDRVLPAQMELYRFCNGDLDRIYGEAKLLKNFLSAFSIYFRFFFF